MLLLAHYNTWLCYANHLFAVEVAEKQVELVAADLMLGQMPKYEKMMIVSYAQTPTFDTPFEAPL